MTTPARRLSLTVAALLLVLAVGAGSAAANRAIAIEPEAIRINGNLTIESGVGAIICSTFLSGTLRRSIEKVERTLAGEITSIEWRERECRGNPNAGELVAVLNLPWRFLYEEFSGTLPAITEFRGFAQRVGFLIRITVAGIEDQCLFENEVGMEPTIEARGRMLRWFSLGNHERLIRTLRGICPEEVELKFRFEFQSNNSARLA
jgi:hypothetical protein